MDSNWVSYSYFSFTVIRNQWYYFSLNLGFHAVTYCLGIHVLNSFIGFISPLQDPEDEEVNLHDKGSFLPQKYK